jgi:hypothetical protein
MQGKSVDIDKMIREYGEVDRRLLELAFVCEIRAEIYMTSTSRYSRNLQTMTLASIGYLGLHE